VAQQITLDNLIALNDELAALARAGVPLEAGLSALATDLPGKLGRISGRLAEQLAAGQSLPEALASREAGIPPLYRAIVEAGIKAGRLPAALEQLGAAARRLNALARLMFIALLYPLMVVLLAYGLFLFFIIHIAPTLYRSAPTAHPPAMLHALARLGEHVAVWGPIFPIVLIAVFTLWWLRSRRAIVLQTGVAGRLFGWIPAFRRLADETRAAGLAEILALLVEHEMPLDQALRLAAEATGDPRVIRSAQELSAAIAAGGTSGQSSQSSGRSSSRSLDEISNFKQTGIPPLLHWLIARGRGQPELAATLRHLATVYRRRAVARAEWLRFRLPVIFTLAIGGTATLAYALLLFIPWTRLLYQLAQ